MTSPVSGSEGAAGEGGDQIFLRGLEVWWHVGVTDAERARPQRLCLSVTMTLDLQSAGSSDAIDQTLDYSALAKRLAGFGAGRSWKLLEALATDLAALVLTEFRPRRVEVEIEKFVVPNARSVAVRIVRSVVPPLRREG